MILSQIKYFTPPQYIFTSLCPFDDEKVAEGFEMANEIVHIKKIECENVSPSASKRYDELRKSQFYLIMKLKSI